MLVGTAFVVAYGMALASFGVAVAVHYLMRRGE